MWRTRVPGHEPVALLIEDPTLPRWWCGCRRVSPEPDCAAPHAAGMAPALIDSSRAGWVWLCGCGHSSRWPHCDGSHRSVPIPERLGAIPRRIG
jgi:CDGSH iron-sulfur domain-containing protein 3